jgi:hypothetical protein
LRSTAEHRRSGDPFAVVRVIDLSPASNAACRSASTSSIA